MYRIERVLLGLGARPDRRGYGQTVLAAAVLLESGDDPGVEEVYARAARLCGCSADRVAAGVRDTVRCIWRHQRALPGWPIRRSPRRLAGGEPGGKAFLYGLAQRLRLAGVLHVSWPPEGTAASAVLDLAGERHYNIENIS